MEAHPRALDAQLGLKKLMMLLRDYLWSLEGSCWNLEWRPLRATEAQPRAIETHLEPWRAKGCNSAAAQDHFGEVEDPLDTRPVAMKAPSWDGVAHPKMHAMEAHP